MASSKPARIDLSPVPNVHDLHVVRGGLGLPTQSLVRSGGTEQRRRSARPNRVVEREVGRRGPRLNPT